MAGAAQNFDNQEQAHVESPEKADGHRNAWILTGYGISGLVLLCVIAYSIAQYAVR